jgi:Kinesin motor domain
LISRTSVAFQVLVLVSHKPFPSHIVGGCFLGEKMTSSPDTGSSVQVAIRVRPLLSLESGSTKCIEVLRNPAAGNCPNVIRIGGEHGPMFCFDQVFSSETAQIDVYEQRVSPLVDSCLKGYNATTLAYGQTGSGKTFSMTGPTTTMQDGERAGIIPRAIQSIFDQLCTFKKERTNKETVYDFEVRIQFLELYGEEIRDLLSNKSDFDKLSIRDIGMEEPEVLGATQARVDGPEDAMLCLARGMLRRVTASTAMNSESSRSHAILSLHVEQQTTSGSDGMSSFVRSKFHFVDLAGSERQKRTQAVGQRLKEGIDINKGLFVLGNVISALGDPKKSGKVFVPYRDSKLTRLLKGSLGGNHKTLMLVCISPSSSNLEESLNCLRYANRAKNIQNNAVVNVDAGTRLLAELRAQVAALASELLRVRKGGDPSTLYSEQILLGLSEGSSGGISTVAAKNSDSISHGNTFTQEMTFQSSSNLLDSPDEVRSANKFFEKSKLAVQQANEELLTMTEELFTVRAEREMYRLRLETLGHAEIDNAFLEKAAEYEREIATLKEAIQASSMLSLSMGDSPVNKMIAQASRSLEREKAQLRCLQAGCTLEEEDPRHQSDFDDDDDLEFETQQLRSQVIQSFSPGSELEAEHKAAEDKLSALTKQFLQGEDEEDSDEPMHEVSTESASENEARQLNLQFSLADLSRSIEEKETLIHQLQNSQKKYATMREFYEEKLKQMEVQVKERESEREALLVELSKLELASPRAKELPRTKELEEQLRNKERHIAGLKKRQTELISLTGVSTRNESEINRLKKDIVSMKTQKVELQKLINAERKSHADDINRMKKKMLHHDKEANKWKKISDQKAAEAEKALLVSKSRLEQIGTLKMKYSNAEKLLRVRTVKRGVLEKAGIDSVLIGRRIAKKAKISTKSKIDIDAVRDFLDKKVADIGKKEAIADKLAHEWEDHLELLVQKQELSKTGASSLAKQNIDIQLKYKEERIRKLAEQLGKQPNSNEADIKEIAFDGEEFQKFFPEASTLQGLKITSRILFGMVVRERRRVATLARTASALNERVKSAEQIVSEKEAAFRSHCEEERAERASLAQNQQEQILSLMELVRNDVGQFATPTCSEADKNATQLSASMPNLSEISGVGSRMAVLANERVEALERQLRELRGERESMLMYKAMEAETKNALHDKLEELERLSKEADKLRDVIRSIRRVVTNGNANSENVEEEILRLVTSVLNNGIQTEQSILIRKLRDGKAGILDSIVTESDSEGDDEVPEWAGDIMADLAIIAEGHIPDALLSIPEFQEKSLFVETKPVKNSTKNSVFDRLTNPNNFTGVQKRKTGQVTMRTKTRRTVELPTGFPSKQAERRAVSQKVEEQLDDFLLTCDTESASSSNTRSKLVDDGSEDGIDRRSVFERLLSPSMYTGTQKDKIQDVQAKKSQKAEEMLDDLLMSHHGLPTPSKHGSLDSNANKKHVESVDITTLVANKVSEYTQKDVFERLQSNTTQSYAVKQHTAPVVRSPTITDNEKSDRQATCGRSKVEAEIASPHRDKSGYTQQNVFERLQKTKTHAFAGKEHTREGED